MKLQKSDFEVTVNIGFYIFLLIKLEQRDELFLFVLYSTKIIPAIENPGVAHVTVIHATIQEVAAQLQNSFISSKYEMWLDNC